MSASETITGSTANSATSPARVGVRLDRALADATGLSRARVQALIEQGRVEVAGRPATSASQKVAPDTPFRITIPAAAAQAAPEEIALAIIYEDAHLIVIDKPAGMVVHPAAGNRSGTLVNALLHHCAGQLSGIGGVARPGIVHRIDKDTSGLLVAAKTDAAHEGLAAQFAAHSVHRRYLAVCAGHPSPGTGTIAARIGRSDADRKKMTVLPNNSSRGKTAVTHYTVEQQFDHASLIACRLETGRTHQVRVHCASIGHALLGDPAYGRTPKPLRPVLERLGFARQALHAAELGFAHPVTSAPMRWGSDLPQDMQELIDQLRDCDR
jgi:23S rRNA pseudouridine1911/1915/1917 synthase